MTLVSVGKVVVNPICIGWPLIHSLWLLLTFNRFKNFRSTSVGLAGGGGYLSLHSWLTEQFKNGLTLQNLNVFASPLRKSSNW